MGETSSQRMVSVNLTVEQWGLIQDALDVAYGEKPGSLGVAIAWVEINEAVGRDTAKGASDG